jgi:cation:H+ antiporter
MWVINLILFLISLIVLVRSSHYAVINSSRLAKNFHLSEFIVSFFIVAVISSFPEATISLLSTIRGVSEFGLATIMGAKVVDLSLVFGIIAVFSIGGIRIKSEILKRDLFYLVLLLIPIILGLDGNFSRIDGLILILSGLIFFFTIAIQENMFRKKFKNPKNHDCAKSTFLLILSLLFLIVSAYYTIEFGINFANDVKIPAFLIAITFVAIGTCLPELIFSLNAVKTRRYELALGDILGTVITDITIIIGIMALIRPFSFNPSIIYVTGIMMFLAGILVVKFIHSGKILTKKEGILLIMFYILSLTIEFIVDRIF